MKFLQQPLLFRQLSRRSEVVEPRFGQALIPVTEASGQHFQDPAPAEPPKLYLPLPVSTDKKGRETLELSRDRALPESQRE